MTRRRPTPAPDAPRLLRDRAVLFLEAQAAPVSSELLAREVLGLRKGSEAACAAILAPILTPDPRLVRTGEGRWILREPAPGAAPEPESPLRARAWAVWAAHSEGRAAAVVRLEGGRIVGERAEPSRSSGDAGDDGGYDGHGGYAGYGGDDDAQPPDTPLSEAAAGRLAALASGALWTSWDAAAVVRCGIARGAPVEAGATPASGTDATGDVRVVPLAAIARACLGPPRPRSLERLAASLGITFVDAEPPLARARLAAECLLFLLDREPAGDRREGPLRALIEGRRPEPPVPPGAGSLQEEIDALPPEPGVYRFFDRDGGLLYVGKARDLRRRVGSYFAARERADPRTAAWLGSVVRIEHERSGSELEALLREASQIAGRAPSENRQRAVHARRGNPPGDLVLVQSAERSGAVRVALVKDGALAARLVLGPRGGGHKRLRTLVASLYFPATNAPIGRAARVAPAPPAGSGRQPSSKPTRRSASREASRALLLSWLRRQPPSIPAFDPTDDTGPDAVCARIFRYASALQRGERDVFYR